jgi:taurine dioxygenase
VLYVNPQFTVGIEGLDKAEGDALLQSLYDHALQAQFEHRFEWREGSVVFWDNRFGWHKALNDYPSERRLMHRITIEGCALEGL